MWDLLLMCFKRNLPHVANTFNQYATQLQFNKLFKLHQSKNISPKFLLGKHAARVPAAEVRRWRAGKCLRCLFIFYSCTVFPFSGMQNEIRAEWLMRRDSPGFSDGLHKNGRVSMVFRCFTLGSLESCASSPNWSECSETHKWRTNILER